MGKILLLLLPIAFNALGCFSSDLVTPTGKQSDLSYAQLNENIGDDEVIILFNDGQKVEAKAFYVTPDTVSWVETESQSRHSMPSNTLDHVVTIDHGLGALIGLGIGATTITGAVFASTRGVTGESGEFVGPAILVAGGGGAVLGGVVGALVGWRHSYEFSKQSSGK